MALQAQPAVRRAPASPAVTGSGEIPGAMPLPMSRQAPVIKITLQYFGQNSGSHLGDGAIVPKRCVLGAGCFQAVPRGSMRRNALDQLWLAGTPLAARQGHRRRRRSLWLTGGALGERDRAHTGMAVPVALGVCARVTVGQTGQRF